MPLIHPIYTRLTGKTVKNAYLAKTLTKYEHGDAADFERPFLLTVAADKATRGNSALVDAVVVIFPNATINGLSPWFSTQPPAEGPDQSANAKHELELERQSRPASFTIRPFIYEQRTRILIPAGFTARPLPADKTTQLGPATLTETYLAPEPKPGEPGGSLPHDRPRAVPSDANHQIGGVVPE